MESYRFLQNIKLRNNASCIMKLGGGGGGFTTLFYIIHKNGKRLV